MLRDPFIKKILRLAWGIALGIHGVINIFIPRKSLLPKLFYGGARPGDVGGPLVKVKRLRALFPEHLFGFNVVYTLSNTPYLPDFALRVLRWRNVPIVHNQNGVFYSGWYDGDWEKQNKRMARTYHQADFVFFQSEFCKVSADKYLGQRSGPGEILYNAVDTEHFRPCAERERRSSRPIRFLLTGKIDDHMYYRIESTLLGLANAHGLDAHLVVAGWVSDTALERAQNLVKDLGLEGRVHFTGRYTQEEAPAIYGDADVYVMTKHNDPCPNTVLEALSCGLPVLFSDSGGVRELVGDAGLAMECAQGWGEPEVPAVADIGQGMVDISEKCDDLSPLARERAVALFDIRDWERRHSEIFNQLLNKG